MVTVYTKKDRADLSALLEAVSRLTVAILQQNQLLEQMDKKLDAVLDAEHDLDFSDLLETGLNNILSYTGAAKRGEQL